MQAVVELVMHVARHFRRSWPDDGLRDGLRRPVEPVRAAAAIGMLAIVAPLGFVAGGAVRLTWVVLNDDLLMFVGLFIAPVLLFAAVLAALGLVTGLAVALAIAVGTPASSTWGWGFVAVGAFQVVTYVEVGWHLLAALTAVATAAEVVLLLCLPRTRGRNRLSRV